MKTAIIGVIIVALLGYVTFTLYVENQIMYNRVQEKTLEISNLLKTSELKVEALKYEVVDDLAKCETRGVKEPDAAIILDSNDEMSIGSWMWQIKSVQHYVKVFEKRDITRVEAIRIAIDHDQARELTKKVIFEDSKGIWNWANCAKKHSFEDRVEIIKRLAK